MNAYKGKKLDIVEIDAGLTELSQQHFDFSPNEHTSLFHEDARTFLMKNEKKYNAVLCDVFSSKLSVPFQLTTLEFYNTVDKALEDNGVFIVNILGSNEEYKGIFLHSQLKTMHKVFPQVLTFAVQKEAYEGKKNYMVVACKKKESYTLTNSNRAVNDMLERFEILEPGKKSFVLTDDYAPVDWMLSR